MTDFSSTLVSRAAAAGLLFATLGAGAAPAAQASEALDLYRKEMAICASGASLQGRKTCAYEAQSAYAQNRRGELADSDPHYKRNARERCDVLQGSERTDCVARMQGQGTTSGSAATGGIYRELDTIVPAPMPAAPAAPAPVQPVPPVPTK